MTIAEMIRETRKAAKMTQQDLADRLGVSYTLISQYERGIRNPKTDTMIRIAKALNAPINTFISSEANVWQQTFEENYAEFYKLIYERHIAEGEDENTAKMMADDDAKSQAKHAADEALLEYRENTWSLNDGTMPEVIAQAVAAMSILSKERQEEALRYIKYLQKQGATTDEPS